MFFDKVKEFINKNFLWIIVALLVIIILIVVLCILEGKKKRKKYGRVLIELVKKKDELLTKTLEQKLGRIKYIGKHNIAFSDTYENLKSEYDILVSLIHTDFNKTYKHAQKELSEKMYKDFNKSCESMETKIETFRQKLAELEEKIDLIVKDDEELKNAEYKLRQKIQNISDKVSNQNEKVVYIKQNLQSYIEQVNADLKILTEYINNGNYIDAKDLMLRCQDKVNYLESSIDDIIKYAFIITKTLPASINSVINQYKVLVSEGYPLKHINLAVKINKATEVLKSLIVRLKKLDVENFESEIEKVIFDVDEADLQMNMEIDAKKFFEESNSEIYESSLQLDREYLRHIKEGKELLKEFESNEERSQLDHVIKTEVQKLGVARRDLDSLNYGNQPYTMRVVKLKELENQVGIVKNYLNDSYKSFEGMKKISDDAKELIDETASLIRNLEIQAMNTKLEKIVLRYQDEFQNAYRLINRINLLITTQPIDVDEVHEKCQTLKDQAAYLKTVAVDVKNAMIAESLIMYANNFRPGFANIARDLAKAEIYFYDGKYLDCIEFLKNTLTGFNYEKYLEREQKDEILG